MSVGLRILGLLALVLAGLAVFVRVVFVHEAVRRGLFPILRPLYKRVFNPRVLRDAARGDTRWGVLHHVGRRSGVAYDTPIDAQLTPEGAVIALVYGASVDWCRNVLAAGGCTLAVGGEDFAFTAPSVVAHFLRRGTALGSKSQILTHLHRAPVVTYWSTVR